MGLDDQSWKVAIVDAVSRLAESGLAGEAGFVGCSSGDVSAIEAAVKLVLPGSYRFFLERCGKCAGEFLVGTDWEYDVLVELQEDALNLLDEAPPDLFLPEDAFVFAMHQGYQFLFLRCGEGDDPPVLYYLDENQAFEEVAPSFSRWFSGCVDDEIEGFKSPSAATI